MAELGGGVLEGVAAHLLAVEGDVVAPGELALQAEGGEGGEQEVEVLLPRRALLVADEGEDEVAAVVVDRSTAALATHEAHAVLLHPLQVALRPRVLVAPDDDARVVLPEVEDPVVVEAHQVGLPGEVRRTVVGLGQVYRAFHVPTLPPLFPLMLYSGGEHYPL